MRLHRAHVSDGVFCSLVCGDPDMSTPRSLAATAWPGLVFFSQIYPYVGGLSHHSRHFYPNRVTFCD